MKFDELKSIGHNIADSLGSGIGLMIGVYEMDVYGEASATPEGFMAVDFLTGEPSGATPSLALAKAIRIYRDVLPSLCERHGCDIREFRALSARFGVDSLNRRQFTVTITDARGRSSSDLYVGTPGRRPRYRKSST